MLDPGQVEGLATGLVDLYSDSEAVLLSKITSAVAAGKTNNWAETQLAEVQKLKYESLEVVQSLAAAESKELGQIIGVAANRGTTAATGDLLSAGITTSTAGVIDRHATQALLTETLSKTRGTHQLILRSTDDAYRKVIAEVTGRVLTGSVTREQAAQQALNRLAKQGITGFVDKAGRRWNAATYVEMATRSSVMRAFAAGHEARLRAQGVTLVRISAHSNPAPQCAPFEGKILSLDDETGSVVKESELDGSDVVVKIFATMRDAISEGLHHCNCRHVSAAYFPGIKPSKQPPLEPADPQGYKDTQQLRALERAVRAAKRDAATIMDPTDRKKALAKVKAAQARTKSFAEAKGLQRRLDRERLQVGDANAIDPGNLGPSNVTPTAKAKPPTPKPIANPAIDAARKAAQKAAKAAEMKSVAEAAIKQQAALQAKVQAAAKAENVKSWLAAEARHADTVAEKAAAAKRAAEAVIETPTPKVFSRHDGQAWGNANWDYTRTKNPFTVDEARAISAYTGFEYDDWNTVLRTQSPIDEPLWRMGITRLDSAFKKSALVPEAVVVTRTLTAAAFGGIEKQAALSIVGQEFIDRGFMSTALEGEGKGIFADKAKDFVLRLTVPKGTRAVYVSQPGMDPTTREYESLSSQSDDENELILDRGARFRVTKVVPSKDLLQPIEVFAELIEQIFEPLRED